MSRSQVVAFGIMKNFLRAVRAAWPYRARLIVSFICAIFAALFWSLNISSVGPVLQILSKHESLQEWARKSIEATQSSIDNLDKDRERFSREAKELDALSPNPTRDKRLRDLSSDLARTDRKLRDESRALYIYRISEWYLKRFCPSDRFQALALVIALVVLTVAIRGFFEFWQESLVGSVVNLSLFDIRNRFYRKVIHFDLNSFSHEGTHELMARFTNDIELIGNGTKTLFGKVIAEPMRALACVIAACFISWQLTLMFLVLVPIAIFILTKVGRSMKRATRRLLERVSSIYRILQETFRGIRVVKAFTMEPYERRRFCAATRDYYHKAMWVVNLDAFAGPTIELMGVAAVALALLAGAFLVLRQQTKLGPFQMCDQPLSDITLLALYALLAAIADPVRKLSSVYTRLQSGAAAADRVYSYMDREPRVRSNSGGMRLKRLSNTLEFRDICFSYEPGQSVLTNVHLRIRAGETMALVGKNGCGKTTLVGLIPRFFDPDHGSVLIDGADIRHVNLRSLRQQIGIVTQETVLFDDTIYNNIGYGSRRANAEQLEQAARKAFAHDFIMRLPEGYQTKIGDAGSKLSGGQKQRIALARAILRDPGILILDEFTSQCDAESETLIHRALKEFVRGRTTLVITHRLNTLEIADRIAVVEEGRIIAVGTHAELLRDCPQYQRLHDAQFQRLVA